MNAAKELRDLPARVQRIRDGIEDLFKNLPANQAATPLGGSCFSMKMSALKGGLNLSPSFYDFDYQHEALNKFIQNSTIDILERRINGICETGLVNDVKLHPEVLKFIRDCWGYIQEP